MMTTRFLTGFWLNLLKVSTWLLEDIRIPFSKNPSWSFAKAKVKPSSIKLDLVASIWGESTSFFRMKKWEASSGWLKLLKILLWMLNSLKFRQPCNVLDQFSLPFVAYQPLAATVSWVNENNKDLTPHFSMKNQVKFLKWGERKKPTNWIKNNCVSIFETSPGLKILFSSEFRMQTQRFCKARFFHAQIFLQAGLGKIMGMKKPTCNACGFPFFVTSPGFKPGTSRAVI